MPPSPRLPLCPTILIPKKLALSVDNTIGLVQKISQSSVYVDLQVNFYPCLR